MSQATWRTLVFVLGITASSALPGASFAQNPPPQGRPAPGKITQPTPMSSETRMGMWRGHPVTYQVINGRNIYQGDIILENVEPMPKAGEGGGLHSDSVGLVNTNYLWPKVNGVAQIPYVVESGPEVANINTAIGIYNATFAGVIQLVPLTTQANYIDINLNGNPTGVCEATEGDANIGEQFVTGASNCTVATILHEFGHVTGVWHEQSRSDAASYVTFNYSNVIKGSISFFLPTYDNDEQNLTYYDWASVMEYPALSFSRNGGPPLDSIPPGMPLSNLVGYSAADVEGIERLYGAAPTEVTVTSNPRGLVVSVDGNNVTTPMTFNWALNSMHTLSVATGVQTLAGDIVNSTDSTTFYYTYGRWNDGGTQTHMITVTPGNGDVAFPPTAPQVATYSANFIQLVPYAAAIFPTGAGSVSPSPTPQSYSGASGVFFVARQQVTLTATPTGAYHFYEFNNAPFWLPGGLAANPKTFYVPDTGLLVDTTAEFTTYPVYTIDVTPDAFSSGLSVNVDATEQNSGFTYTPRSFSPDPAYDGSAWASGTMHTLDFSSGLEPFSSNTQFVFSDWTPGGTANPLTITVPASSQSYVATIIPEFAPATNFGGLGPCGGSATLTSTAESNGNFYPSGSDLKYTATPITSPQVWTFAGWTYDLTGTTNPDTLTADDETLVYANFNTTSAPLTVTSLSPASVASGGSQFTLTLNGTGFTSTSNVAFIINGVLNFVTVTSETPTQLQVTVPATFIASPGSYQVFVENYPTGWNGCAVFGYQPFFVSQGTPSGATTVTATPATVSFSSTAVDATSTGTAVTVKNTGSTSTTISVAASANFGQSNTCPVAPSTLAAGVTCTITSSFTPTSTGPLTGNITVTDSASNSAQVVMLSGIGLTTVTPMPTTLSFGSEAVGGTTAGQPVTVQNTGFASTTISVAASTNYGQTNNCGATLAGGATCTITVTFSPTTTGSLPGTVTITDYAANSPQMVSLTGTGTAALTTVTVTPTSETFAAQTVGTTSAGKTVTIKNTGSVSTSLSIGTAGDFAAVGAGTTPCGGTLVKGASCTISVTFSPTATGTLTGAVSVTDSAMNSPQMVKLTGTGKAATVIVTPSPTSETFASQTVGTSSAPKTVTIKNTGTGSTSISFGTTGDFAETAGTCTGTLGPSPASCTVMVTFTPTATGSRTGTLTITDAATNSPQMVKLSGTGVAAVVVTATPTSETFAAQTEGTTSAAKVVTVKNTGSESTTISFGTIGDFAQTNTCGGMLAGGKSCTASVTFTPTATGTRTGALTITDTASNSPQSVALTGTGKAPTVVVTATPTSETFAAQHVGTTSAPKTVTIKNTGTGSTSISFGTTGDFAETAGTCTGTLGPSPASCTVMVTFTPTATGSRTGTLTITDAATNSPQSVKLTGTGE